MMIVEVSTVIANIITTIIAIGVIRDIMVIRMMDTRIVATRIAVTLTIRDTVVTRDIAAKMSTEGLVDQNSDGITLGGLDFIL
jgi:hypothetical protein